MSVSDMTDDEAVAAAILLGCTFWKNDADIWFMIDNDDEYPPLEQIRLAEWQRQTDSKAAWWGWNTQGELARDFIAWRLKENARDQAA